MKIVLCPKHLAELETRWAKSGGIEGAYGEPPQVGSPETCEHLECIRQRTPVRTPSTEIGQEVAKLVNDADSLAVGVQHLIRDITGVIARMKREKGGQG